jgi:hypothetical protein
MCIEAVLAHESNGTWTFNLVAKQRWATEHCRQDVNTLNTSTRSPQIQTLVWIYATGGAETLAPECTHQEYSPGIYLLL